MLQIYFKECTANCLFALQIEPPIVCLPNRVLRQLFICLTECTANCLYVLQSARDWALPYWSMSVRGWWWWSISRIPKRTQPDLVHWIFKFQLLSTLFSTVRCTELVIERFYCFKETEIQMNRIEGKCHNSLMDGLWNYSSECYSVSFHSHFGSAFQLPCLNIMKECCNLW